MPQTSKCGKSPLKPDNPNNPTNTCPRNHLICQSVAARSSLSPKEPDSPQKVAPNTTPRPDRTSRLQRPTPRPMPTRPGRNPSAPGRRGGPAKGARLRVRGGGADNLTAVPVLADLNEPVFPVKDAGDRDSVGSTTRCQISQESCQMLRRCSEREPYGGSHQISTDAYPVGNDKPRESRRVL